ncbi:MAG: RHS repeat-associated core domain-containing protein, partial [Janthinobacterium lividum]
SQTVRLPTGVTTNTSDQNDRIATVNGSATHSYDLDGNEKTVAGQTASYDFENHLVSLASVANGTVLESYAYDADGNRYSVYISANTPTTTSYVVDTSLPYASVVEEYSGSTLAARYDYGDDLVRMDRSSPSVSTSYYLYDGLGSTRQLVSTTGAPTDTWGYSAFGELAAHTPSTGGTVNPFLFNAQQFDTASGNYYLRARYYDQSNGRFVSQDPYDGSDDDPVSLHRYLYAGCNPVDNVDPSGNDFGEIDTLVANGIAAEEDAIITPATANIIASQFAGRAALSFATSPAGVFAARAILTSFVGIPAILISAAAVESAFASEDDDDDEQKPNYYFRGTSVGFPGGANAQKFQVSETSSDPAIATAFALNKQSYGGTTIVEAASRDDLTGLEITKAPDMTFGQELGWYVFTPPTDFAARASIKISSQSSRTILQGMGVSLSYITYSRDDLTQQLRALDGHHLSEPQIQSYVAQAKAIGN